MKETCTCTTVRTTLTLIAAGACASFAIGAETVNLGTTPARDQYRQEQIGAKDFATKALRQQYYLNQELRANYDPKNAPAIAGGACPNPAHDCCTTGTPGCSDEVCCDTVCASDSFCCTTAWDGLCVDGAVALCGISCGGGDVCPNPKHDCFTAGGPGCSDEVCCDTVCACDPFCCETAWDTYCAGSGYVPGCGALVLCGGGKAPANDNCADRTDVFDGSTPFSTIGATTDGLSHATCNFFGDPAINQDIWFNYVASGSGQWVVETCGSGYDTEIAVYLGCNTCPPGDADLVACNDDACGLQSRVLIDVVAGQCYKIRVGGFGAAQGTGTLTIGPFTAPAVCGPDGGSGHDCYTQGGPGCTDGDCCAAVCAADPFCCDTAWDGVCVNGAFTICGAPPCDNPCPPGALVEGEPCGSDTNGGCNGASACGGASGNCCIANGGIGCEDPVCQDAICGADPFCCDTAWDGLCADAACNDDVNCQCDLAGGDPFETLECGDVVCGTFWADNNIRDTDWYRFEHGGGPISWEVKAGAPTAAFILNNVCPPAVLAVGAGVCPTVATSDQPAGTYVAFAATSVFAGFPCGSEGTEYVATLSCVVPCPADINGDGVVNVDDLVALITAWGPCPQ